MQSNWTESDSTKVDYIKNKPTLATVATSGSYNDLSNKPTIPAAQVQADWSQSSSSAVDYIKNKPSIPTKTSDLTNDSNFVADANYVHTDNNFTSTEKSKLGGIASGAEVNVQANWNETSSSSDAYILNKPNLSTVATSGSYNDLSNKPTIPSVEANPSVTGSTDLTKLEIDGTVYNIPSGQSLPLVVQNGKLCIVYES